MHRKLSQANGRKTEPAMKKNSLDALQLDEGSINPEDLSMHVLTREISLQKRPNGFLSRMMNALEGKRQEKGMGWSRSWNKYGMNTFRTHICDITTDIDYLLPVDEYIKSQYPLMQSNNRSFVGDLLQDSKRMVYTFYHNGDYDGEQFEGITLSMGRVNMEDRTKRDRLDIVMEDKRTEQIVDGVVDKVRIILCPWDTYKNKDLQLIELDPERDLNEDHQTLYKHLINYYHKWKVDENRQWSHWSTRYIDYFGPRQFIPTGSSFT